MKILITGIAGFVGSTIAKELLSQNSDITIYGLDNFIRPGSENNRLELKALGVTVFHGDIRNRSDSAWPCHRKGAWANEPFLLLIILSSDLPGFGNPAGLKVKL